MFPETLETDRLRLLRFCRDNVAVRDFYEAMSRHSDTVEEETAHVGMQPHDHLRDARDAIRSNEQLWDDGDRAIYAVVPRETEGDGRDDYPQAGDRGGAFAGFTGLSIDWDVRSADLGTWLRKPYWGRGYLGERTPVMLDLAFDTLDLELVASVHLHGNEPARRAIRKYVDEYGGRYEGRLRSWEAPDGEPRDAHRYTISRDEYRAATE